MINIINRFLGSFINKLTWIALILLVALISFFFGLSKCHALEVDRWSDGGLDSNLSTIELVSNSSYTYENYNSSDIREIIYNYYNEIFYENSLSMVEFYKIYNYIVKAQSESTIRVYIQNYSILMDYQGVQPIEGLDTRFFFYNLYTSTYVANITTRYFNIGVFYNTCIDINYNTKTYSVVQSSMTEVYRENISVYQANPFPTTINLNLIDSLNNNFAWVEDFAITWLNQFSYNVRWRDIGSFAIPSGQYPTYYYGLPIFPELEYVAGVPGEDNGGGDSDSSVDLGGIEDKLDKIDGTLTDGSIDNSKETIENIINDLDSDYGAFTDFVLLPINFISSMLEINNYCYSLNLDFNFFDNEKSVSIPNGCSFWSLFPQSAINLYHMVCYGIYCYAMGIFLFKYYEKFKNPSSSEVKTLDL